MFPHVFFSFSNYFILFFFWKHCILKDEARANVQVEEFLLVFANHFVESNEWNKLMFGLRKQVFSAGGSQLRQYITGVEGSRVIRWSKTTESPLVGGAVWRVACLPGAAGPREPPTLVACHHNCRFPVACKQPLPFSVFRSEIPAFPALISMTSFHSHGGTLFIRKVELSTSCVPPVSFAKPG